jgi:hypothetical protein
MEDAIEADIEPEEGMGRWRDAGMIKSMGKHPAERIDAGMN